MSFFCMVNFSSNFFSSCSSIFWLNFSNIFGSSIFYRLRIRLSSSVILLMIIMFFSFCSYWCFRLAELAFEEFRTKEVWRLGRFPRISVLLKPTPGTFFMKDP